MHPGSDRRGLKVLEDTKTPDPRGWPTDGIVVAGIRGRSPDRSPGSGVGRRDRTTDPPPPVDPLDGAVSIREFEGDPI